MNLFCLNFLVSQNGRKINNRLIFRLSNTLPMNTCMKRLLVSGYRGICRFSGAIMPDGGIMEKVTGETGLDQPSELTTVSLHSR